MGQPSPPWIPPGPPCRNCGDTAIRLVLCDLGYQPLANSYLTAKQLDKPQQYYPLAPTVCRNCGLIQLPETSWPEEMFPSDYAYYSSQSSSWVAHVRDYAVNTAAEFGLTSASRVLEIASNDGATLGAFRDLGIPAVGIEPAETLATASNLKGLATIPDFFGKDLAWEMRKSGYRADLVVANNVLAHVPNLDDFLVGVQTILAKDGIVTFEFPDAEIMVKDNLFDTIYHEHYSYFTVETASDALLRRNLEPFRVERLDVHGGSIRLYARSRHLGLPDPPLLNGALTDWVHGYDLRVQDYKAEFLEMLTEWYRRGLKVVGYGAPAKASTLFNYCGVGPELVDYVVDSTPAKQGRFLPGSRIPIYTPDILDHDKPDVILILPWNWTTEIMKKIADRDCIIYSRLEQVGLASMQGIW